MPEHGDYLPSTSSVVRAQVAAYEASAGQQGSAPESGLPIIIVTTRGARSGKVRKTPLMRIERDGCYVLVASNDGKTTHPAWYHNLKKHPEAVIQDGPDHHEVQVRELDDPEYSQWWQLATNSYGPYGEYQSHISRRIPVLLAEPR